VAHIRTDPPPTGRNIGVPILRIILPSLSDLIEPVTTGY
jgi:hypothetical protein